jgi:cell shape-determining protein MreC
MTSQKINSQTIDDLVDSEGDECSVAKVTRMLKKMFKKFKDDIQKQFNEAKENTDLKKTSRRQKQLNELKKDLNKHQNETK